MFRATVLSIVLVFAAGPSASLFCEAWCQPQVAAAQGCHHQDRADSTNVAPSHSCQDVVLGSDAVVKEDLRRPDSSDGVASVRAVGHLLLAPGAGLRSPHAAGRPSPDLSRPLTTPLRI